MGRRKRRTGRGQVFSLAEFQAQASASSSATAPDLTSTVLEEALRQGEFEAILRGILAEPESLFAIKGGMIRDLARGLSYNDIDCICNVSIPDLSRVLAELGVTFTVIPSRIPLVIITLSNGRKLDLFPVPAETSKEAFFDPTQQCDFSINSAFLKIELANDELHAELKDPDNICRQDYLRIETLVKPAESFLNDAFRVLRAIHYSLKLDAPLTKKVRMSITKANVDLGTSFLRSPRRLIRELSKLFSQHSQLAVFEKLEALNLHAVIFPDACSGDVSEIKQALSNIDRASNDAHLKLTRFLVVFESDLEALSERAGFFSPADEVLLEGIMMMAFRAPAQAVVEANARPSYSDMLMRGLLPPSKPSLPLPTVDASTPSDVPGLHL